MRPPLRAHQITSLVSDAIVMGTNVRSTLNDTSNTCAPTRDTPSHTPHHIAHHITHHITSRITSQHIPSRQIASKIHRPSRIPSHPNKTPEHAYDVGVQQGEAPTNAMSYTIARSHATYTPTPLREPQCSSSPLTP